MKIKIINPIQYDGWNELLLTNHNYCFFHSTEWAKVLIETYNYKPVYILKLDKNKLTSLIPFMEINNTFIRKKAVSLPFSDFSKPIINQNHDSFEYLKEIFDYGEIQGWQSFEIRGGHFQTSTSHSIYIHHILDLSAGEEKIYKNLRHSTITNIKKAIKNNVKISLLNSIESIEEYYKLQCLTRRNHGLPPQPKKFFNNIYEYIIKKNKGIVALAYYNNKIIAGGIFFNFGEKVIHKYAASNISYNHLRPNNLLTWEMIKYYLNNNYISFSFGRTDPLNKGLIKYKDGWTKNKEVINYYFYDFKKNSFQKKIYSLPKRYHSICKKLPLPILKIIGRIIYKYYT